MAFALDLLIEPGELRTYTKFAGYKALKRTNTFLDRKCKRLGIRVLHNRLD